MKAFFQVRNALEQKPVRIFSVTWDEAGENAIYPHEMLRADAAYSRVSDARSRRWLDLLWSIGGDIVLSSRLIDVLVGHVTVGEHRFVPTTIAGGAGHGGYSVLAGARIDALDRSRSRLRYYKHDPTKIAEVYEIALDRSVIGPADWFVMSHGGLFVSETVAAQWQALPATGVNYVPVI